MHAHFAGIDGMRALAVTAVVGYHMFETRLPGGFYGVDIFFTISGFVVTASIYDMNFLSFSEFLGYFYARRFLRIFPAAAVCIFMSSIFTILFVPSSWISKLIPWTAITAMLGVSNILLSVNNDNYFSPVTELNPFMHTWSLGVEEQFYLIFPFIIFFTALKSRKSPSLFLLTLTICVIVSSIFCLLIGYVRTDYSFYLLPSRFWQLGIGAIAFAAVRHGSRRLRDLPEKFADGIVLVSLSVIVACLMSSLNGSVPVPNALPVTMATTAILMLIAGRPTILASRALGLAPIATVGRASYSLYLWHWPVIVLLRWTVGFDAIAAKSAALVVMASCTFISYRFIEQPFRNLRKASIFSNARVVAAGLVAIGAVDLVIVAGFKFRPELTLSVTRHTDIWYPTARASPSAKGNCRTRLGREDLLAVSMDTWTPLDCRLPRPDNTLYVIGDSHSSAYTPIVQRLVSEIGLRAIVYTSSGCAIVGFGKRIGDPSCEAKEQAIWKSVMPRVMNGDIVFLASLRLPRFADQAGDASEGRFGSAEPIVTPPIDEPQSGDGVLARLVDAGVKVIVEEPLPVFKSPPFRCSDWFNHGNPVCAGGFMLSQAELNALREPVVARMRDAAARLRNITLWDPVPALCPSLSDCKAFQGRLPLFFDGDHLSGFGNDVLYVSFKDCLQYVLQANSGWRGDESRDTCQ